MDPLYEEIRNKALAIASGFPEPSFYTEKAWEFEQSRMFFHANPVIAELCEVVSRDTQNDFGHGIIHAVKVTIDAGALVLCETRSGTEGKKQERLLFLAQIAGLLHDIARGEKDHARKGAERAAQVLADMGLCSREVEDVREAIANHEAFVAASPVSTREADLLSGCLYDADKFRWGPDNFTETVWRMVSYFRAPLGIFMARYPEGMVSIEKIKSTFRTQTGRIYGPEFIDLGLAIGREILAMIKNDYGDYLDSPGGTR
ncbi:MAG: HD domain-containing protein [Thermodesulfobacteriota bacterium]